MIGNFYRPGQVYCAEAQCVLGHDFPSSSTGMSIPHGIFDIKRNEAYVTIGTSKDTSEFNCDCIQLWWNDYGKKNYPNATKILILSDGGGSNSSRHYILKQELQDLSNETGMIIRYAYPQLPRPYI